jgi:DNA polymerase I
MHIRLIDANSLGYAQHHANDLRIHNGIQTQAVHGVLTHLRKNLQFDSHVLNVLIWDGRAQWRYDALPLYKSSRQRTEEQREKRRLYEEQRPWIQKAVAALPVIQVTHPEAEADDLAWGLSQLLERQGHLVTLYTADSDWLQMVTARVRWCNARKPSELVDSDNLSKLMGYASTIQLKEAKALMGDSSDDIPGLTDVAQKRAVAALAKYGSLEKLLIASEDVLQLSQEPKYLQALGDPKMRDQIRLNQQLIDLSKGPALRGTDVRVVLGENDGLSLYELFVDLNFRQWQEAFKPWEKVLESPLSLDCTQSIQRAIGQLHSCWEEPRS